jgi:predicted dehydrogenase
VKQRSSGPDTDPAGRRVVRIGVAGLGGYAAAAGGQLLRNADHAAVRLVAACDPDPAAHAARTTELRGLGVEVVEGFDRMLAVPMDAVWLPVPIALHRPFTERALAAGLAVLVEKPAAGTLQDVDAMIAARDRSGLPVAVAFQTLFAPDTWQAKRRLLAGELGAVRRASVTGCWPRGDAYFGRNAWAGRLRHGDAWVLDSPANNAMAHYLNLALFLLGPAERVSADPTRVEAELYRANPIENYDTCTLRLTLPGPAAGGVPLLVAMTHACEAAVAPLVRIEAEHGTLEFEHDAGYRVVRAGGAARIDGPQDLSAALVRNFADLVRGDRRAEVGSLENARVHTRVVDAVSEAAGVADVPAAAVRTVAAVEGRRRVVPGLERALTRCAAEGRLLSETGLAAWAVAPGVLDLADYAAFSGPRRTA